MGKNKKIYRNTNHAIEWGQRVALLRRNGVIRINWMIDEEIKELIEIFDELGFEYVLEGNKEYDKKYGNFQGLHWGKSQNSWKYHTVRLIKDSRVKDMRMKTGLSKEEFAKRVGIDVQDLEECEAEDNITHQFWVDYIKERIEKEEL